jgi:hypothetical protein
MHRCSYLEVTLLAALLVAGCSSGEFSAADNSGGAPNPSDSGGEASGGAIASGAGNGGSSSEQAGTTGEQAGAAQAEGGAVTGAGGEATAAGAPAGGSPSEGGAGQPAVDSFKAFDDFVESGAGWAVTGDVAAESPALYSGGGGNPNGAIYWIDGGGSGWYFVAPAKYLGNDSAFYGGVLRFDLKVTAITSLYTNSDVELTSDTLTLVYDCTPNPTTKYTTYSVPLDEVGWKVGTLAGAAATVGQFKQVLGKLTRLRIRGEFNAGSDTGHLDNVYFGLN